jgi:hypothetical protein
MADITAADPLFVSLSLRLPAVVLHAARLDGADKGRLKDFSKLQGLVSTSITTKTSAVFHHLEKLLLSIMTTVIPMA